jgi:hypothetical protein
VAALVIVVIALFSLGRPGTPKLANEPVAFNGRQAAADLREIAQNYPQRVAGTSADNRLATWLVRQFKSTGLETHVESFPATVNGKDVSVKNVWAVSRGDSQGSILVIANRDTLPLATQGANDNASGVAMLLELARSFKVTAHNHSMIFLSTSGDALGALGSREFAQVHHTTSLFAVIALRRVATRDLTGVGLDGWSTTAKAAPPWLWLVSAPAARSAGIARVRLPSVATQILRLAVPASSGAQGPFVARGVPGITLSAAGRRVPAQDDTLETVSTTTLTKMGNTAMSMMMAIDGKPAAGPGSGGTIFLRLQRTLPGGALAAILAALLLPLGAVTVDLLARCRRASVKLGPAIAREALHLAPWLVLLVIVYLANAFGQLPKSPGAVIPPDAHLVMNPRYLRVVVLLALMVLAYAYAVAVERRIERRVPADPRATIFVAHAALVLVALCALLIDPYSVLLVLPAAMLWPLARPGGWARSILPAYLGLIMIPVVLVYYAVELGIGSKVWWYFFLLLENRTIPASVVLLAVLFFSTAGILAHTLHERGLPPGALTWPAIDRRSPERLSDDDWARATGAEPRRPRRRSRRSHRGR